MNLKVQPFHIRRNNVNEFLVLSLNGRCGSPLIIKLISRSIIKLFLGIRILGRMERLLHIFDHMYAYLYIYDIIMGINDVFNGSYV